jgi:hypothetical protein
MAQQTAVEIFYDKIAEKINNDNLLSFGSSSNFIIFSDYMLRALEQAKEMEKQQHEEIALAIAEILLDKLEGKNGLPLKESFDQYYTQTYGK